MDFIRWFFSGIGVRILDIFLERKNKKIESNTKNIEKYTESILNVKIVNSETNYNELNDPILKMYNRICRTLLAHEIDLEQFIEFIGSEYGFNYGDIRNPDAFISKMSPKFIIGFCNRFGIRKEWLEGEDNEIYETIDLYKNATYFRDILCNTAKENNYLYDINRIIDVFVLKSESEFDADNTNGYSNVSIIVRIKLSKINGKKIYKYKIIKANLEWKYWKSRRDLKEIIAICIGLNIPMNSYVVPIERIKKIGYGSAFPGEILYKKIIKLWYPDDYIIGRKISELELDDYALYATNLKEIEHETRKLLDEMKKEEFELLVQDLEKSN